MTAQRPVPPQVLLGAGAVASGLSALVFVATGTRYLGLEGFQPLAQLWTLWAVAAAALTFSYQQIVIRRSWAHEPRREPLLVILPAVVAASTGVATYLLRLRLFGSTSAGWPLAAAVIPLGCSLIGAARGRWAARDHYPALAVMVGGENAIRALVGMGLVVAGAPAPLFAAAILAGFLPALISPRGRPVRAATVAHVSSLHTLTGAAVSGLIAHGTLVVAPVLLAAAGRPGEEISAMFAFLALTRAPYQIAQGLIPRAANIWTGWAAHGRSDALDRLHRLIAMSTLAGAVVATIVSIAVGDRVAAVFFDAGGVLDARARALAAVLVVFAIGNLTFTVAAISTGAATRASSYWLKAIVPVLVVAALTRPTTPAAVLSLSVTLEVLVFVALAGGHLVRRLQDVPRYPCRRRTRARDHTAAPVERS